MLRGENLKETQINFSLEVVSNLWCCSSYFLMSTCILKSHYSMLETLTTFMSWTKARPNLTSTFCVMFCTGRISLLYPRNRSLTRRSSSSEHRPAEKKDIFYSKRLETNGVSGQVTQTHVWTYEKEVMGDVFHNLYLSSIIMNDETNRERRERGKWDAPSNFSWKM